MDPPFCLRMQTTASIDQLRGDPAVSQVEDIPRIVRTTVLWVTFCLVGCYYPKYLAAQERDISTKTPPFQVLSTGDVVLDFALSEKVVDPPTISSDLLIATSIWLPMIATTTHAYFSSRRNTAVFLEMSTAVSSLCMAIGLSEGSTQMLKLWVQRRRPSFYDLCGFDRQSLTCTADIERLREANFSFPSGHSSLCCCGMTFLVLYTLGKHSGSQRVVVAFIGTVLAAGWCLFVAASRLVDQWHHPSDVVAGLGLGFWACTVAYHFWYPPIWSNSAGVPLTRIDFLETKSKLPTFSA